MTAPLDAPGASKRLEGHCRCGAVRYDVADEFQYAMNCHCVDCRAATGAACKPIAGVEREKLSVVAGEDQIMLIGDELANDQRCARCGSFLFSVVRDGEWVHVGNGVARRRAIDYADASHLREPEGPVARDNRRLAAVRALPDGLTAVGAA